jgi:thiamine-monophosphate kinase
VHFFPDDPPDAVAQKALRVNLSDLAAKARPPGSYIGAAADRGRLAGAGARAGADAELGCPLFSGDTVRRRGRSRSR